MLGFLKLQQDQHHSCLNRTPTELSYPKNCGPLNAQTHLLSMMLGNLEALKALCRNPIKQSSIRIRHLRNPKGSKTKKWLVLQYFILLKKSRLDSFHPVHGVDKYLSLLKAKHPTLALPGMAYGQRS